MFFSFCRQTRDDEVEQIIDVTGVPLLHVLRPPSATGAASSATAVTSPREDAEQYMVRVSSDNLSLPDPWTSYAVSSASVTLLNYLANDGLYTTKTAEIIPFGTSGLRALTQKRITLDRLLSARSVRTEVHNAAKGMVVGVAE